jgi:hypothetical protein
MRDAVLDDSLEESRSFAGSFVSLEVVHSHRRGHPRSPRGTVTLHTHSREAVISSPGSLGPTCPLSAPPPSPPCQLFSPCLAAGIASHRIASHRVFSCGSRLTEGCISHNVARGLPQHVSPVGHNNVPVNSASACTPPRDVALLSYSTFFALKRTL